MKIGSVPNIVPIAGGIGAAVALRRSFARAREADLTGDVALVTGGSRGLGLAMARELADQGCRLVICARDRAELQRAGEDLEQRGVEVLAVECDVAAKDDVDRMVAEARRAFGRIDLLVCNAGVIQIGAYHSMELEDFRQSMDIMYWGVLYPILAVLPEMRERRSGRIAVVSSIGGKVAVPHMLPYSAAKFAAAGLAEGLRSELADEGITVTHIAPGLTRTGSYLNAYYSGDREGQERQYKVFAPLSSLPFVSGNTERAARAYIAAIRRGDGEVLYPPVYNVLAKVYGVAPATTTWAMGIADRLLPDSGEGTGTVPGRVIDERLDAPAVHAATIFGRAAAEDHLEHPGPTSVPDPD